MFNPRILNMVKSENYVRGTFGGCAQTTKEFLRDISEEKEMLKKIEREIKRDIKKFKGEME